MEKKLKIGIIGTGSISESHIHAYRKNPNVEVYAFCDIREDRLKEMGEKYGVTRLYTDKDVMLRDVITVSKFASLEDATYLMYKNKVGILPVVDNDQVSGVITDRDIFRAFLEVSGYGEEGVRVRFVTEDKVGVLEQIIHLIVEEGYNIANTVNIPTKDDRVVIEVQIDGVTDLEGIRSKFEANGLKVDEITRTTAKAI